MIILLWMLLAMVLLWVVIAWLRQWALVRILVSTAVLLVLLAVVMILAAGVWPDLRDAWLAHRLEGRWHAQNTRVADAVYNVYTEILPGGRIQWTGIVTRDGRRRPVEAFGAWVVEGGFLRYEVEESNGNPLFPAGLSDAVRIAKVDRSQLVYRNDEGQRYTEVRVDE